MKDLTARRDQLLLSRPKREREGKFTYSSCLGTFLGERLGYRSVQLHGGCETSRVRSSAPQSRWIDSTPLRRPQPRGVISSATPATPKPESVCHVSAKVRFAHFPVPLESPRGQRRTVGLVRTEMEERFVFASSTMPSKAMMIF